MTTDIQAAVQHLGNGRWPTIDGRFTCKQIKMGAPSIMQLVDFLKVPEAEVRKAMADGVSGSSSEL